MSDWHVLGAGAIGCLFAAELQKAGNPCCLILREPGQQRCDIEITHATGREVTRARGTTAAATDDINRLLITTKAYDVETALRSVAHRLGKDSEIVLLVNGMGLIEQCARLAPDSRLFAGTTTEGAYRTAPLCVQHAGSGLTRLGGIGHGEIPHWYRDWQAMSLRTRWEANIEAALWHKLAINCAINPLTALHSVRNGELNRDSSLQASTARLCQEIAAVSAAAGYRETAETLAQDVREVIQLTANNRSSMLQDVLAGQRTEIDFITGYLVRRADTLGIAAEYNRQVLQDIKAL